MAVITAWTGGEEEGEGGAPGVCQHPGAGSSFGAGEAASAASGYR